MPKSDGLLAILPNRFSTAAILLFFIQQTDCIKNCVLFEDLLPQTIFRTLC